MGQSERNKVAKLEALMVCFAAKGIAYEDLWALHELMSDDSKYVNSETWERVNCGKPKGQKCSECTSCGPCGGNPGGNQPAACPDGAPRQADGTCGLPNQNTLCPNGMARLPDGSCPGGGGPPPCTGGAVRLPDGSCGTGCPPGFSYDYKTDGSNKPATYGGCVSKNGMCVDGFPADPTYGCDCPGNLARVNGKCPNGVKPPPAGKCEGQASAPAAVKQFIDSPYLLGVLCAYAALKNDDAYTVACDMIRDYQAGKACWVDVKKALCFLVGKPMPASGWVDMINSVCNGIKTAGTFKCWNGTMVEDPADCPDNPGPDVPDGPDLYGCVDCSEVDDPEACEEQLDYCRDENTSDPDCLEILQTCGPGNNPDEIPPDEIPPDELPPDGNPDDYIDPGDFGNDGGDPGDYVDPGDEPPPDDGTDGWGDWYGDQPYIDAAADGGDGDPFAAGDGGESGGGGSSGNW